MMTDATAKLATNSMLSKGLRLRIGGGPLSRGAVVRAHWEMSVGKVCQACRTYCVPLRSSLHLSLLPHPLSLYAGTRTHMDGEDTT